MKKLLSLFLYTVCVAMIVNISAVDVLPLYFDSFIRVVKNEHHYCQYFIEPIVPITHINDIDLQKVY